MLFDLSEAKVDLLDFLPESLGLCWKTGMTLGGLFQGLGRT